MPKVNLTDKGLAALHDLIRLAKRFEEKTKWCLCMARDENDCRTIAKEMVKKAEEMKL